METVTLVSVVLLITCGLAFIPSALIVRPTDRQGLAYTLVLAMLIAFAASIIILAFADTAEGAEIYDHPLQQETIGHQSGHVGQKLVLVTEVAWAGTHASHSDEWFELYNNTDQVMYLMDTNSDGHGWLLRIVREDWDTYNDLRIPPVVLQPGEYAVFERTDDNALVNVAAKGTYSGSMPNTDVRAMLLIDGNSILQHMWAWDDDGATEWPVGSNQLKASAQFDLATETWVTSNTTNGALDADYYPVWGTPGEANYNVVIDEFLQLPFVANGDPVEEDDGE